MKFKMNQIYVGNIEKIVQQDLETVLYEGYGEDLKSKQMYDSYMEKIEDIGLDNTKKVNNTSKKEEGIKSTLYKEGATLIKLDDENNLFVDVDNLRNESDIKRLKNVLRKLKGTRESFVVGKFTMESSAFLKDELYVDLNSVERVYSKDSEETISLEQIRKVR